MENWILTWTKLQPLNASSVNAIENNLAGVYRLSYLNTPDNKYYVFYVGQSTDIKKRLLEHLSGETNEKIKVYLNTYKCYFRLAQISADYIRNAAESQMYKHYEPPCNDVAPVGRDDVRVNLT